MRTTTRRVALAGAAVAATLAVAAPAQALPPLVNVSCGQLITTSIRMNNDLVGCTGDGLVIGANNVSIDMNFHSITGDETPAIGNGTQGDNGIENDGFPGAEVKNGTIRNFNRSVSFLTAVSNSRIYNVRSLAARNDGLQVEGSNVTIDFNEITIPTDPVTQTAGVLVFGANNRITRNTINGGRQGINFALGGTSNLIDRNRVVGADFGITTGLSHNVVLSRNTVSGGIAGFHVQLAGSTNLDYVENEVRGASGDGFFFASLNATSLLDDNDSTDNGDDGIDIEAGNPTLRDNEVRNNGDWGIEAPASVVDGGGNEGSGNGQPAQCQNVSC